MEAEVNSEMAYYANFGRESGGGEVGITDCANHRLPTASLNRRCSHQEVLILAVTGKVQGQHQLRQSALSVS